MREIKLTKRYPQSRTEDIVDAYMRGWNDALDAVQNGKFIINDDRKTENSSEKPNNFDKDINVRSKDEPQKWETPPKFEHKGITTTCVNVMASRLEYEPQTPTCETCRYDELNNPKCDECIAGKDKPSNYEPQTDCPWK